MKQFFASALAFVAVQAVDPNCTISLSDDEDSTVSVYYDAAADQVVFDANIKDGSFAGFGWGASMQDTEMVIFSANGDSSALETYYGIGTVTPELDHDMLECYDWSVTNNGDKVNFLARRSLECDVHDKTGGSYVVQLDTELDLISSWNPNKSTLSYHGKHKIEFKQTFKSDGTCAGVANKDDAIFSNDLTNWMLSQFGQLIQ